MLRFLPDSFAEGLLRPFLMVDPVAGLYFEDSAPDWRFAMFLVLMGTALALRRRAPGTTISMGQGVTAFGTVLLLYLWTFISGNGRYFAWGFLLIGPLLVMASQLLPGSRSLRWTVLLVLLALQGVVLALSRTTNAWAAVLATDVALPLEDSPLRHTPAVFLTITSLSYSILVPQFHAQSRWSNISGQYNILKGTLEWDRLQGLLSSRLPKYLVMPVTPVESDPQGQPIGQTSRLIADTVARFGLALVPAGCVTLPSKLPGPNLQKHESQKFGFWVCALKESAVAAVDLPLRSPTSSNDHAALNAVERQCPRFFPPGGGLASLVEGSHLRKYSSTDVKLWVDPTSVVQFQYFRAMNPTTLGTVDDVREGRFSLACDKLPGRYLPFWQRD